MLKLDLKLFNGNTEGERYSDMSAIDIKVDVVLMFFFCFVDTEGKEVLKLDLTLFNGNMEGERYSEMSAIDIKVDVVLMFFFCFVDTIHGR